MNKCGLHCTKIENISVNIENEELESWYDETYQVMLLCILENNYKESLTNKIEEIKTKIN